MKFPIKFPMKFRLKKKKLDPIHPLAQQRAETLAQMGSMLQKCREEQGYSLLDMTMQTKISQRLLQAIEAANENELPEPIYIQGLIRQYADALGLNGTEFASTFPTTTTQSGPKPVSRKISGAQLRPFHLYVVYIFLIVCSVNGLSNLVNRSELQADKNSSPDTSSAQPDAKPTALVLNPPQQLKPVTNSADNSVNIDVTLKAQSWIRVVADGKTTFEGVLPEGSQRSWKAQEQLTVRAGNAGGVLMTVNRQPAKQMGNPGEVQEVTIAANPRM